MAYQSNRMVPGAMPNFMNQAPGPVGMGMVNGMMPPNRPFIQPPLTQPLPLMNTFGPAGPSGPIGLVGLAGSGAPLPNGSVSTAGDPPHLRKGSPGGSSRVLGLGLNDNNGNMRPQTHLGPTHAMASMGLKPAESSLYEKIWNAVDPSGSGMATGQAVKLLFQNSNLPKNQLATIWSLSDRQKRKWLDREDFYLALKLVSLAQNFLPVNYQAIKANPDLPLPVFMNINPSDAKYLKSPPPQDSVDAGPGFSLLGDMERKPPGPINPNNYNNNNNTTVNPNVSSLSSQPLSTGVGLGSSVGLGLGVQNVSLPPAPLGLLNPPLNSPSPGSAGSAGSTSEWSMSEAERSSYSSLFVQADVDNDNFVSGGEAFSFFKQSGLDNATLRQVWLLADIDKDGKLSSSEFAIAMHIVMKVRRKVPLPQTLPPELDPRIQIKKAQANSQSPAVSDFLGSLPKAASANVAPLPSASPPSAAPSSMTLPDLLPSKSISQTDILSEFSMSIQPVNNNNSLGSTPSSNSISIGGLGPDGLPVILESSSSAPSNNTALASAIPSSELNSVDSFALRQQYDFSIRQNSALTKNLEDTKTALASFETQNKTLAETLAKVESENRSLLEAIELARKTFFERQEELKNAVPRINELTAGFGEMRKQRQELDMQNALLESQLTQLRSQLKNVEDKTQIEEALLKEHRDQYTRLLREKQDITDLLDESKISLQKVKNNALLLKSAIAEQTETNAELRAHLTDHRNITSDVSERARKGLNINASLKSLPNDISEDLARAAGLTNDKKKNFAVEKPSLDKVPPSAPVNPFEDDAFSVDDVVSAFPAGSGAGAGAGAAFSSTLNTSAIDQGEDLDWGESDFDKKVNNSMNGMNSNQASASLSDNRSTQAAVTISPDPGSVSVIAPQVPPFPSSTLNLPVTLPSNPASAPAPATAPALAATLTPTLVPAPAAGTSASVPVPVAGSSVDDFGTSSALDDDPFSFGNPSSFKSTGGPLASGGSVNSLDVFGSSFTVDDGDDPFAPSKSKSSAPVSSSSNANNNNNNNTKSAVDPFAVDDEADALFDTPIVNQSNQSKEKASKPVSAPSSQLDPALAMMMMNSKPTTSPSLSTQSASASASAPAPAPAVAPASSSLSSAVNVNPPANTPAVSTPLSVPAPLPLSASGPAPKAPASFDDSDPFGSSDIGADWATSASALSPTNNGLGTTTKAEIPTDWTSSFQEADVDWN